MSTMTTYCYSNVFKQKVIQEIEESLVSIAETSRIYEISHQSLYKWIKGFGKDHLTCSSGQAGREGGMGAETG